MPRKGKPQELTCTQLASCDDFITHNLLDNIHYWSTSRKVNANTSIPEIERRAVVRLLKKYVIDSPRPSAKVVVDKLFQHRSTRRFIKKALPTVSNTRAFKDLMKQYIQSYLPDCGFEVSVTDRFFRRTGGLEGCVVARQNFECGVKVKYLTGSIALLTPEEEENLRSDLSVITVPRLGGTFLMLGPCRFVNHNCSPNAKISGKPGGGTEIITTRRILPGEEITVSLLKALEMELVPEIWTPNGPGKKVGGRTLRQRSSLPRDMTNATMTILDICEPDRSIDSLAPVARPGYSTILKRRSKIRTLHKLYMVGPYSNFGDLNVEKFKNTFDCLNCGVYFYINTQHKYKEYCPRCVRHQLLYELAWPDTELNEGSASLALRLEVNRASIAELIEMYGMDAYNITMSLLGSSSGDFSSSRDVTPVEKTPGAALGDHIVDSDEITSDSESEKNNTPQQLTVKRRSIKSEVGADDDTSDSDDDYDDFVPSFNCMGIRPLSQPMKALPPPPNNQIAEMSLKWISDLRSRSSPSTPEVISRQSKPVSSLVKNFSRLSAPVSGLSSSSTPSSPSTYSQTVKPKPEGAIQPGSSPRSQQIGNGRSSRVLRTVDGELKFARLVKLGSNKLREVALYRTSDNILTNDPENPVEISDDDDHDSTDGENETSRSFKSHVSSLTPSTGHNTHKRLLKDEFESSCLPPGQSCQDSRGLNTHCVSSTPRKKRKVSLKTTLSPTQAGSCVIKPGSSLVESPQTPSTKASALHKGCLKELSERSDTGYRTPKAITSTEVITTTRTITSQLVYSDDEASQCLTGDDYAPETQSSNGYELKKTEPVREKLFVETTQQKKNTSKTLLDGTINMDKSMEKDIQNSEYRGNLAKSTNTSESKDAVISLSSESDESDDEVILLRLNR
ncbi:Histone-lysine N-methyltransferase SET9 [Cyberlindnera fabianii]|uniref:Histone-lysine N-methyltransferase SET9 n=1 Tax=Cyberlindnera fabianii TaxID=36022 RepID=A0A1V2L206_CYBFA|nr:Histone-lysine N-methyltransferase SET9 [Cyberlindnera fabianii]